MFKLLVSLEFLYGWVMLRRLWAWVTLKPVQVPPGYVPQTKISVIVAIRNEEGCIRNLLHDLTVQKYPRHLYEVILIDDHSEDKTAVIIQDFARETSLNLHLIKLAAVGNTTGKKAAVNAGIAQATGELLVFTDGDCRVQPWWLVYLEYVYTTKQAKFISGPVLYEKPENLFGHMQLVEFASLIGAGGSSIALNKPNMCNGANMAYPKIIFKAVGGFIGNAHIPSGDDEFLMHKIHQMYPGQVVFVKARPAIVLTPAKPDFKSFMAQRIRWASKWPAYQSMEVKVLALLIFTLNFALFLAAILAMAGFFPVKQLLWSTGAKLAVDLAFMAPVLYFFRKTKHLFWLFPLQVIYIPYVVVTALAGLRGSYQWKGRHIKR